MEKEEKTSARLPAAPEVDAIRTARREAAATVGAGTASRAEKSRHAETPERIRPKIDRPGADEREEPRLIGLPIRGRCVIPGRLRLRVVTGSWQAMDPGHPASPGHDDAGHGHGPVQYLRLMRRPWRQESRRGLHSGLCPLEARNG